MRNIIIMLLVCIYSASYIQAYDSDYQLLFDTGKAYEDSKRYNDALDVYKYLLSRYPNDKNIKNKIEEIKQKMGVKKPIPHNNPPKAHRNVSATSRSSSISSGKKFYSIQFGMYSYDNKRRAERRLNLLERKGFENCYLYNGKYIYVRCGKSSTIRGLRNYLNKAKRYHLDHFVVKVGGGMNKTHTTTSNRGNYGKYIKDGFDALNNNNLEKATNSFENALNIKRRGIDANYGLALVYMKKKDWKNSYKYIARIANRTKRKDIRDNYKLIKYRYYTQSGWDSLKTNPKKALNYFKQARKINQTDETLEGLAYSYLNSKDWFNAIRYFKILYAKKKDLQSAKMLLIALNNAHKKQEALSFFNSLPKAMQLQLSEFDPNVAETINLANKFIKDKKYKQAENLLQNAYTRMPTNTSILLALGNLYIHMGQYKIAQEFFRSVYYIDNNNLNALKGLADTFAGMGNYDKALNYYRELEDKGMDVADSILDTKIKLYIAKKDYKQAIRLLEQKIQKDPSAYNYNLLANLYEKAGQDKLAFMYYSKVYAMNPKDFNAKLKLLYFNMKFGNIEQVKFMLRSIDVTKLTPSEVEALQQFKNSFNSKLAVIYLQNKQYADAEARAKDALLANPNDKGIKEVLAWAALNNKDFETAREAFLELYKQKPDANYLYGLGLVYLNSGNKNKAIKYFDLVYQKSNDIKLLSKTADLLSVIGEKHKAILIMEKIKKLGGENKLDSPEPISMNKNENNIASSTKDIDTFEALLLASLVKKKKVIHHRIKPKPKTPKKEEKHYFVSLKDSILDAKNPSFVTGLFFKKKPGVQGLDKLRTSIVPYDLNLRNSFGNLLFKINVDGIDLKSGVVKEADEDNYGTYAGGSERIHDNIAKEAGFEPKLSMKAIVNENLNFNFYMGTTPQDTLLDPLLLFGGQINYSNSKFSFDFSYSKDSIKDSLLSYVGEMDLYSDKVWGRVVENSMQGNLNIKGKNNWSYGIKVKYSPLIQGDNTIKNSGYSVVLTALKYRQLNSIDSLLLGPMMIVKGYDIPTYHFTYGHGGYYSPSTFNLLGLFYDYTKFKQLYTFKLKGNIAYLHATENEVKKYPFDSTNDETYPATSTTMLLFDLNIIGGYKINRNLQINGYSKMFIEVGYSSFSVGTNINYYFISRIKNYKKDLFLSDVMKENYQ